jgi:hypothetical protein
LAGRIIIFKGGNKQFFTGKSLFFVVLLKFSATKIFLRDNCPPPPSPPSWPADGRNYKKKKLEEKKRNNLVWYN